MKRGMSRKPCFDGCVVGLGLGRFVFAAAALTALTAPALGGPTGEKVISGQASFSRQGSLTTIHASNNAIINYAQFNIGAHETVRFVQPSSTARVLNRVTSHDPSFINGTLLSNGLVYIANPAGIFFGGSAIVNVGGLVAAAGTITNQDFLASVDRFTNVSGEVRNLGSITGSSVDLVGQFVENHGVIYADRGTVTMSAGDEVFIGPRGGGIYVKVKDTQLNPQQAQRAGVENAGTISAPGGASLLTAGDLYSLAVRNTGTVRAERITLEGTGAGVVHAGGTLDASNREAGGHGGTVHVLGGKVGLFNATIDASGDAGGGTVLVGGAYQGGGSVRNAERTYVSAGSVIRADATREGEGGVVIVWSDQFTRFQGVISATGGASGGDGGFAEVSGKLNLEFAGSADLRAERGRTGTLLLDPNNLTIQAAGANTNVAGTGTSGDPFTTTNDNAILLVSTIEAQLGASSVVIQTGTGGTNAQDGDITVAGAITAPANGNSLTLLAHDDIFLNANIDMSASSGNLILRADGVSSNGVGAIVNGGGTIIMGSGGLRLNAGSGIGTLATPIQAQGVNNFAAATTSGGIFFTNSGSGNLNIDTVAGLTGVTAGSGNISITTTVNSLDVSQAITGGGTITLTSPHDVTVNDDITAASGVTIIADSDTNGGGAFTLGTNDTIAATNSTITITAPDIILTNTSNSLIDAGNGTVNLLQSVPTGGGAATIGVGTAATGTFNVDNNELDNITAGTLVIGDATGTGAVDINALGFSPSYNLTISGGAMDAQAITMGAGRTLTLVANGAMTLNAAISAPSGAIALTSTNNTITTGAAGTLTASGGTITLQADDLSIGAAISTGAGTGTVNLVPNAGRTVGVSAATAQQFDLSDAEIDFIQTSTLVIGANNSGAMLVDGLLASATTDITNLTLSSGSTIAEETADNAADVTISGVLTLNARGAIGTSGGAGATGTGPLDIDAGSLVAAVTVNPGGIFIKDTGGITLTSLSTFSGDIAVRSTAGLTASLVTANSNIELIADSGNITTSDVTAAGGGALTVTATAGAVSLGATSCGSLTVTAGGGNISDTGTVTVTGNASFTTTQSNADIDTDQLAVGGTIALSTTGATGDAAIVNATAVTLAASSVGGALSATATTGNVTDSGAVTATSATFTTIQSGADITLDTTTTTGAVSFNTAGSGGDATYSRTGDIVLGTSNVGGNLTLSANAGSLSDTGTATVGGNAAFTTIASGNINLDQLNVNGGSSTIAVTTPGFATIVNGSAVRLAASTVGSALSVTATTGNITTPGLITVPGAASFTTSANNATISVSLLNLGGGGSIALNTTGASGHATVTSQTGVNLATSNIGGNLTATAQTGGITDSGIATVGGTASFTTQTAGQDILLDLASITGAVSFTTTGPNAFATLINAIGINLGASSVGGDLTLEATTGSLFDTGIATVSGNGSFTTVAGGTNINLDQLDINGASSTIAVTTPGFATIHNAAAVRLAASTVGTALTVTATTGDITDTAAVSAASATFTTSNSGNDITLSQTTATGAIRFNTTGSGGDATYTRSGSFDVGLSNVGGSLSLTATGGGSITDSATVTVGGNASFTTTGGGGLTLDQLNVNGASSTIALNTSGSATIVNGSAIRFAASMVGGDLSATATTGNITDNAAVAVGTNAAFTTGASGADIVLDATSVGGTVAFTTSGAGGDATFTHATGINLGASNVGGTLSVTATTGDITDAAAVAVGGNASFTTLAANDDITLDTTTVSGAMSVNTSGATGNAMITHAGALNLGASSVGGNLVVSASGGGITDSGTVAVVNGTASFTTTTAGQAIALDQLAVAGGDISVTTSGAGGHATIGNSTAVTYTASVGGNLSVTAATGDINDNASTVGGAATFTTSAAGADILIDATASATGSFAFNTSGAGGNATLVHATGVILGVSGVGGALDVTATTGTITDSGTVTVGGAGLFTTAAAGQDIILDQLAVTGQITPVTSGAANVTIVNATGVNINGWTVGGNLAVTATTGDITDSAATTVGGNASFTTGASGADIALDELNVTGTVAVNTAGAGGNASIVNAGALTLAASSVGGTLAATATSGNLTDSGTVTVGNGAAFTTLTGGNIINLDQLAVIGPIALFTTGVGLGSNATIVNAGAVDLAASTVGGQLFVTATTGDITDSGVVSVNGQSTWIATSGAINLDQLAAVGQIALNASGNASLVNASAVTLRPSNVGGNLSVTATTGAVADNGTVTVGGAASFTTAAAGAGITLDQLAVTGSIDVHTTGASADATIVNATAVDLAASSVGRDLSVTATTGGITDSGAVAVGRNAAFTTSAADGAITLNQISAAGSLAFSTNGANGHVTLVNDGPVNLAASTIGGRLDVTAFGAITDSGTLTVNGQLILTTRDDDGADITLDDASSAFGAITARVRNENDTADADGDISIRENAAMVVNLISTDGRVTLQGTGDVRVGAITADRSISVTAGGSILEIGSGDAGVDFTTDVLTLSATGAIGGAAEQDLETTVNRLSASSTIAGGITITETDAVILESVSTASGDITVNAGGAIGAALVQANSNVTLTSASGGIQIGQISAAGAGSVVTLTATGGSIGEVGSGDAAVDVTAGTLIANAGTTIGSGGELDLETNVGTLTATAPGGMVITNIGPSANTLTATLNASGGAVNLATNGTLATGGAWTGDTFTLSANDMQIGHTITAAGAVAVHRASPGAILLGSGSIVGMTISGAEFQRISATGLTIGGDANTTSITVRELAAPQTNNITGLVLLDATAPGGSIAFSGASESVFNALRAQADNGITVQANVRTDTGLLALNADFDNAADGVDSLVFSAGRTLTAAGNLTLSAFTGGMDGAGNLTLVSGGSATINHALRAVGRLTINADAGISVLGNTSSTGQDVRLNADADANGAGALTVAANRSVSGSGVTVVASDVVLNGSIDAGTADASITRSTAGTIDVGANNGAGMVISGAELGRVTARDLTIGDAAAAGARITGITVDGVGTPDTANISGTVILGARSAGGGTVTFSGGPSLFPTLRADASGAINVNTEIATTAGDMSLNNGGALTIAPGVTTLSVQGSFAQAGAGAASLGASITATGGTVSFSSPVTLTDDVVISGSGASFGSSINSDLTPRTLTINSGGATRLLGGVGTGSALASLTTDAGGTTELAGDVAVTGGAALLDDVTLSSDVAVTAGGAAGARFGGNVTGPFDFTVSTPAGDATFMGGVNLSGTTDQDGGNFSATSGGDIAVAGLIDLRGGTATGVGRRGGNVTLNASSGSVRVGGINTSGSNAVAGAGGDAGTVTLLPDLTLVNRTETNEFTGQDESFLAPAGLIELTGDITALGGAGASGADGADADILLAGAGRSGVPAVATIIGFARGGNGAILPNQVVNVALSGRDIIVGANEKIVVNGTFSATATRRLRVGDIVAAGTAGDILLTSPLIEILTRPSSNLLFQPAQGRLLVGLEGRGEGGTDFVARGRIVVSSPTDPVLIGSGGAQPDPAPRFAAEDAGGSQVPDVFSLLQIDDAVFNMVFDSTPPPAEGSEIVIDLDASGTSAQSVATSIGGALPQFEFGEVSEVTALDTGQRDKIRQLGITPRDPSESERLLVLLGRTLYNDYPQMADPRAPDDYATVVNRLPSDRVAFVLDEYDRIFNRKVIDPTTGQTRSEPRTDELQEILSQAVRRYRQQSGVTTVEPGAMRQYLEEHAEEEADALALVRDLQGFLRQMELLGLGPRELKIACEELLTPILPRGISTADQFRQLISGAGR